MNTLLIDTDIKMATNAILDTEDADRSLYLHGYVPALSCPFIASLRENPCQRI
jgi:hypothetical protein